VFVCEFGRLSADCCGREERGTYGAGAQGSERRNRSTGCWSQPLDLKRFLHIAIGLATALGAIDQRDIGLTISV
jgi:hypothetical protein